MPPPALLLPPSLSALVGIDQVMEAGKRIPSLSQRLHLRRLTPAEADIPPWLEHKRTHPHALAESARDAIRQLHAWNADSPPEQEDASDITLALETDQNFPEPTPEGILPLRAAVGTVTGEPPDPQGWHPAVDYLALLGCLLPQLRDAEHAGAHVLLLVTDSRNFLSIPHFPYFIRHLVARIQWEGKSGSLSL